MGDERTRRRFLELAGVGAALTLAGCGGSNAETGTGTTTSTADASSTKTANEPSSTTSDPATMSTVFHFSAGTDEQKHAIANVSNLLGDGSVNLGDVALVANGAGIKLVSTAESKHVADLQGLLAKGVSVYACENSMAAFGLSRSDLVSGVQPVPSGVGQLTKLQAGQGYAYVKTP